MPDATEESPLERAAREAVTAGQDDRPITERELTPNERNMIAANVCPECGVSWDELSPGCPHLMWDKHPRAAAPGAELALMSAAELEAIVGTRTVPVREWAESLVQDTEFPDDDPDEMALGILAGILLATSSEEALAVTNLQRAKELCGNMPGGHSPLLEITAAMPFKSTYEQGAPCYAMVSATVVSTGEKFKFTTGARAVQAVIIAHLVHGWMPFRCLITMRATPTQRGYYPLNLEAGG